MHPGTKYREGDCRHSQQDETANLSSPLMVALSLCGLIAGRAAHLTSVPGS